jgi:hypothetical protein
VNLIDKKKDQLKLGMSYAKVVDVVRSRIPCQVHYEWFDFHGETKKKGKWNNLSKLIDSVGMDLKHIGFFCKVNNAVVSRQCGIVRTNCMDNLDRTNVTQSLFARQSLLAQVGADEASRVNVMESPFKKFEKTYKTVWAHNADAISTLYAGTGALKVDFTKTGKRTVKGMYNDLMNSIFRYYINNFLDGSKQDSIDVLLGKYKPSSVYDVNKGCDAVEAIAFRIFALLVLLFAVSLTCVRLYYDLSPISQDAISTLSAITALIAALMVYGFWMIFKHGSVIGKDLATRERLLIDDE